MTSSEKQLNAHAAGLRERAFTLGLAAVLVGHTAILVFFFLSNVFSLTELGVWTLISIPVVFFIACGALGTWLETPHTASHSR